MRLGKPKVYRVGQQAEDSGRSQCFSLETGFLFWETSVFARKAFSLNCVLEALLHYLKGNLLYLKSTIVDVTHIHKILS